MRKRNFINDIEKVVDKLIEIQQHHQVDSEQLKRAIRLLTEIKIIKIIEEESRCDDV